MTEQLKVVAQLSRQEANPTLDSEFKKLHGRSTDGTTEDMCVAFNTVPKWRHETPLVFKGGGIRIAVMITSGHQ